MAQLTWIRERQGRSWRMPGGLMITGIDYAFLLEMLPGIINLSLYVLIRLRLNDYSCFQRVLDDGVEARASAYFSNRCSLYETGVAGLNQMDTVSTPREGAKLQVQVQYNDSQEYRINRTVIRTNPIDQRQRIYRYTGIGNRNEKGRGGRVRKC